MKPGTRWPVGIVTILTLSVVANLAMMRVANNDPSFAVEYNYYQRAVDFDSTLAHQAQSDSLHWTANVSLNVVRRGVGELRVELRDSNAFAVSADSIVAVTFYNARANDRSRVLLLQQSADSSAVYRQRVPLLHAGQWEVEIEAWHGLARFMQTSRVEVLAAPDDANRPPTK